MKQEELQSGLKRLFLSAMARDYAPTARSCEKVKSSYEQYLAALVELELQDKDRIRTERLIKEAKIPLIKLVNDYDFSAREGIGSQEVMRLCEGGFVKSSGNVVFYGSFGVGKSHLAMAITRSLCKENYRCLYTSMASLINELIMAQKNLTLSMFFKRLDRFDLITIDELGYIAQGQEGSELFFQLISQRYERRSLMITTNLTYSEWDQVFISKIATAAAIDRIIHNCETFNIKGPSWRELDAKKRQSAKKRKDLNESKNSNKQSSSAGEI
ncbi:MAG: IS21-like element helper ATPase IstB [Proteobacteria bacterium]|nr:IS21-like element helper ATPase IstB [Pseudomonadota bacterium]